MKKALAVCLILAFAVSLAACKKGSTSSDSSNTSGVLLPAEQSEADTSAEQTSDAAPESGAESQAAPVSSGHSSPIRSPRRPKQPRRRASAASRSRIPRRRIRAAAHSPRSRKNPRKVILKRISNSGNMLPGFLTITINPIISFPWSFIRSMRALNTSGITITRKNTSKSCINKEEKHLTSRAFITKVKKH